MVYTSTITYGTAISTSQLDATASVAGTFVYTPAAGTIPLAGSQTLSVTFMPSDTTDYNSASDSVTLTVNGNLGQAVSLFGAITQVYLNSGDADQDPAQITLPDGKVEIMWIRSGAVYTSLCVVATGDITATCSSPALAYHSASRLHRTLLCFPVSDSERNRSRSGLYDDQPR